MILPGSRSVLAQPSSRLPIPVVSESSTVEWQSAQVIPTFFSRSRPSISSTVPSTPTTAPSLMSATVTAGSVRSTCPAWIASNQRLGECLDIDFQARAASASSGLREVSMNSCSRSCLVQSRSSPKVS